MYVVIVGMGEVGRHLVEMLDREGHDVVAIDQRKHVLEEIEEEHDVATLQAHGGSPDTLRIAKVEEADLLVTSTENDELNIVAAMFGKKLGAKRCIARLHHPEYTGKHRGTHYDLFGIDVVITPRILVAHEIARVARTHGALDVMSFVGNRVEMVQVKLSDKSKMLHKALANLNLPKETLIAAIVRDDELFIPGGADVMLPKDRIYIVGKTGQMEAVLDLFTKGRDHGRVFIVGGGVIGSTLAGVLEDNQIETVLVDNDPVVVEELSEALVHTEVVLGDGTDISFLETEHIKEFDFFCSVTRNDEVNLMAGLIAKREGVQRVISLVQRPEYEEIYSQLGIDQVMAPRKTAVEQIMNIVRQESLRSLKLVEKGQAEMLELVARQGSRIVGTPIRRLNLPRGAILTAIVSGDEVTIPRGSDSIKAGDTVVVLTTSATRPAIERLFRKRAL